MSGNVSNDIHGDRAPWLQPELNEMRLVNDYRSLLPKFHTLWAINGPLEPAQLRHQLDRFRAAGLDGVVFHPRFYPGTPPYLSDEYCALVSQAIEHARAIGLSFWLYDEDGWPSGTAGGQLLRQYPEHAQRWVGLFAGSGGTETLAEFTHEGKRWSLAERRGAGVDYLDPGSCRRFIELTYERYRTGLTPGAFEYVEAFFCDEPEFGLGHLHEALPPDGAIPWTPRLPELYRARHGEDLLKLLPALFFPLDGHEEVRVRFWEFVTDLFCDAFVAPLDAWCRQHGKFFTAHVKGEEHPLFQVPMVGSCHQVFRRLGLPAIDALERYPSNDFYPRQVSAAARQFGTGRCMVEAFGGAGWGATPADLERYLLWLGRHGITDFVLHLSQYRLDSAAMHDWPPSQPLHLTWTPLYAEVLAGVRAQLHAGPRPAADTLVVAPNRGIMARYAPWELLQTNIHDAGTYPPTAAGGVNARFLELIERLHAGGVNFDLADERSLEETGQPTDDGGWRIGHCSYPRVIVPDGCRLSTETLARLGSPPVEVAAAASRIVPESPPAPVANAALPLKWTLEKLPVNSWLLECTARPDGWFTASFANASADARFPPLEIFFADEIEQVFCNDTTLAVAARDGGSIAVVPSNRLEGSNRLCFRATRVVERPFAWLEGFFRVKSESAWEAGPGNTMKTDGPFRLAANVDAFSHNLVPHGFPFLRRPIYAGADLVLAHAAAGLRLEGWAADAVRLSVDGHEGGWSWQADGRHDFHASLAAGVHRLRIEMIPNTFNGCGPHHYYGGDWFVVSPGQIKGIRNFADPIDAPARTHVEAWHFRRFLLPREATPLPGQTRVAYQKEPTRR